MFASTKALSILFVLRSLALVLGDSLSSPVYEELIEALDVIEGILTAVQRRRIANDANRPPRASVLDCEIVERNGEIQPLQNYWVVSPGGSREEEIPF